MFARVGVGKIISSSNFEFSLQNANVRGYGINDECSLLVHSRRDIDLSERDMSCELGKRVDVRYFPKELGTDDCSGK